VKAFSPLGAARNAPVERQLAEAQR
jgi:hypothetical protein